MLVLIKVKEAQDIGIWGKICDLRGLNPYGVNEGTMSGDDDIYLTFQEARDLGLTDRQEVQMPEKLDRKLLIKMAKIVPSNCWDCNVKSCTYGVSADKAKICTKQVLVVKRILRLYRLYHSCIPQRVKIADKKPVQDPK